MKKKLFFFAAMAAAVWFTGCNKEESHISEYAYHVHFDANGATEGIAPEDMAMEVGKTYNIPINMTKEGCEFLGLGHIDPSNPNSIRLAYGNEDGTSCQVRYFPMEYTSINDTLFAIWDKLKVTITYHSNGASGEIPQQISFDMPKYQKPFFSGDVSWHDYFGKNYGRPINLPDTVILDKGENLKYQDGYYFTGWNTKADGSGVFLPKGLKYANAKDDIDLYAVFETLNDHEYVDLGLPSGTLWAKTNIGTTCEAKEGYLFAYGETSPKNEYTFENWKLRDDEWDCMFTLMTDTYREGLYINGDKINEKYDNIWYNTSLLYMQDAASVNWGNLWRIPTQNEWKELFDNCTVEDYNYVLIEEGVTLPSKMLISKINGKHIFLPANTYFSINNNSVDVYKLENEGYFTKITLRFEKNQNFQSTRPIWSSYDGEDWIADYWDGVAVRPVTKLK